MYVDVVRTRELQTIQNESASKSSFTASSLYCIVFVLPAALAMMSDLHSAGHLSSPALYNASSSSVTTNSPNAAAAAAATSPSGNLLESVKAALGESASKTDQEKKLGEMIHQLEALKKQMATGGGGDRGGGEGRGGEGEDDGRAAQNDGPELEKMVSFFMFHYL